MKVTVTPVQCHRAMAKVFHMRTTTEKPMRSCLLALCVLLAWSGSGHATPPRTPISLDLALSRPPGLNEWATLAITVESVLDAPGTTVELMLPPGVLAPTTTWTLDLRANTPVSLSAQVFVTRAGNLTLSARALRPAGTGAVWGDMKSIPLTIGSPVSGPSVRGWSASEVPVAAQAQPGDATVLSSSPTPFSFAGAAAAEAPAILPSVAPGRDTAGAAPAPPAAPGSVTLTGTWQVADRSNVNRAIDQQLIEIRHGDGSAL